MDGERDPRPFALVAVLAGALALATVARWRGLAGASALGDAVGPYLSAARPDLWPPPHAPIYGGALAWPHRLVSWGASSLWEAMAALAAVQALAAPLAGLLAWRLTGRWAGALAAGAVVALDPSLLDTAASGAEGYLGALAVGLVAWSATSGERWALWAPWALAWAIANHPLCVCAAPLLALAPRSRGLAVSAAFAALAVGPQAARLWSAESGGGESGLAAALQALDAWLRQGEGAAVALIAALCVGLAGRKTRPLALATTASLAALLVCGAALGYLRDHHVRLLTIPAAAGLAALPEGVALLVVLGLRMPAAIDPASSAARRPGTLGLETQVVRLLDLGPPLVVEGAWVSGAPAVEPGAAMLDLHLRGWPAAALGPGGRVALVVTAEREDLTRLPADGALRRVHTLDRGRILAGDAEAVRAWTAELCAADGLPAPRIGGAWDGLAALHPNLEAGVVSAWQGCSSP